jgi:hypothetical protein
MTNAQTVHLFRCLAGLESIPEVPEDFTLTLNEETKEFEFEFGRESRSAETASRNKNVSGVVAADSGFE